MAVVVVAVIVMVCGLHCCGRHFFVAVNVVAIIVMVCGLHFFVVIIVCGRHCQNPDNCPQFHTFSVPGCIHIDTSTSTCSSVVFLV